MHGRACTVVAVLAVAALATACGDDDDDSASTDTTDAESTTTEDAQAAAEADVIEAYDAHWQDLLQAGDPPTPDAPFLADHRTGAMLDQARDQLQQFQAEGVVLRGGYVTDPTVSELTDDHAVVRDCGLDQLQLVVPATGEVVRASDTERDGKVAELVLEGDAWKVMSLMDDEEACS